MTEANTLVREGAASEWGLLQTTMTPITMPKLIFQQSEDVGLSQE